MTALRRVLCFLFGHPWQPVWFVMQPHIIARECRRCGRHERKLGPAWLPAGDDWGWV